MEHELLYRPMTSGLAHLGVPNNDNPHWYCACGQWTKKRNPRTGTPHRATAEKHHRAHVRKASSGVVSDMSTSQWYRYTMLRSDIKSIQEDIVGLKFNVAVETYSPKERDPWNREYFGLHIPLGLQSSFWVVVTTWYCERERIDMYNLPNWTPLDLAFSVRHVVGSMDRLYFESFQLVEDDSAVSS